MKNNYWHYIIFLSLSLLCCIISIGMFFGGVYNWLIIILCSYFNIKYNRGRKFRLLFRTHRTDVVFGTGGCEFLLASKKQRPGKGRRKSIETVKNQNLVVAVAASVGYDDGSAPRADWIYINNNSIIIDCSLQPPPSRDQRTMIASRSLATFW